MGLSTACCRPSGAKASRPSGAYVLSTLERADAKGSLGAYQGVSMPIGGAMAENATLFVVYNQTQAFLRRVWPAPALDRADPSAPPPLPIPQLALSAALAGACASFVLTPVELVKCKMQVQNIVSGPSSAGPAPGPVAITRAILARDGVRGLWLGQTGTLIRETGGSAAWFTTFEVLSAAFVARRHARGEVGAGGARVAKGDLSALELMASGAAAGVTYNCVLFPADCIKSTIQTEDELRGLGRGGKGEGGARRSFVEVGRDIYRARGVRGLYSGCGVTAMRAAPSSALIFYMFVLLLITVPCRRGLTLGLGSQL